MAVMKYYQGVFVCLLAISLLVMLFVSPVFDKLYFRVSEDGLIPRLGKSDLKRVLWGAGPAFNASSQISNPVLKFLKELSKNFISSEHRNVLPYEPDTRTRYLVHLLELKVVEHFGVNIERMTNDFMKSEGKWSFKLKKGRGLSLKFDKKEEDLTIWERFHSQIQQFSLYDPSTGVVDRLMNDVATLPIINSTEKSGGTQLKMVVMLANKGSALLKPQRFAHDYESSDDHFYFTDFERHFAEIAGFHLDRVLGYYRAPPVVGRWINITSDIKRYAKNSFRKTFFRSPANNVCFHGSCKYYCDVAHAICGRPDHIEASVAAFLPNVSMKHIVHPWRRSYRNYEKAAWEKNEDYCKTVYKQSKYKTGRRLLDLMDLAVLDFLMGNMDRHHYVRFRELGNMSSPIHWDQGRGFGKAFYDDLSILAPIRQCCRIRYSTLVKLLVLYHSPLHLSGVMRRSLEHDMLPSVLTEAHLVALDRRLPVILTTLTKCLQDGHKLKRVIRDDGF